MGITCWSAGLEAAMTSLTLNHDWGDKKTPLEKTLSPNDWRLKEIHAYRRRIAMAEQISHKICINKIREEVDKCHFQDDEWKIRFLYEHGMSSGTIGEVLGIDNNEICKITRTYHIKNFGKFTVQDVLANIRSDYKVY